MSDFAAALGEWSDFFAYIGTTAATLLGLLFVAVSLRLDVFRRDDVVDVRDFARLTLTSFLTTVVVCGVTLMPHARPPVLAVIVAAFGVAGVLMLVFLRNERARLQAADPRQRAGPMQRGRWTAVYVALIVLSYVGLVLTALLIWWQPAAAFLALGGSLVLLLGTGTVNAWIMLSNAGRMADST